MVLRLALIYRLLDESAEIRRASLESALEVWCYAEASVAHTVAATLRINPRMKKANARVRGGGH
jgi:hypothetical protein